MRINELKYLIDELENMKKKGGAEEIIANFLLDMEATEYNIRKCMNEIEKRWMQQQKMENCK